MSSSVSQSESVPSSRAAAIPRAKPPAPPRLVRLSRREISRWRDAAVRSQFREPSVEPLSTTMILSGGRVWDLSAVRVVRSRSSRLKLTTTDVTKISEPDL